MQNYHKHTWFSNPIVKDSCVSNEDYAKRAVELGHDILSSCEHGCQGAYRECADIAIKYGLKWRYVAEAYFVKDRFEKDKTNAHLILAAKTFKGTEDINFALSEANLTGYYFRPRVDLDILLSLDPKDVFVTTACIGGVFKYGFEEAEKLIVKLHRHFGNESFMLEVQYHDTDEQRELNRFILSLYRKYGIPLIAGMDSHYIFEEGAELRDKYIEASGLHYADEDGWFMDYPSDDEAYNRFVKQGVLSVQQIREAMDNTNIFLTFEDIVFDKSKKLPTLYPSLTQEERNQKYAELVYEKWAEYKFGVEPDMWAAYEEGIRYEVDTITSTNTSDYFLLDYELVKRAKEKGGMLTYTGRGSGPSYFTNCLLGFTSIDRFAIPVTMYPDRFISKDRLLAGNLPDLDLNCGNPEVFAQAQAEIMGEWRSAPMVAFGTLKRPSAWKMYARANNVPFEVSNAISAQLKKYELDVKHAEEDDKDDFDVFEYVDPEYHDLLRKSEEYMGMVDNISPHSCAHLICQNDIRREIGIFRINSKQSKKIVYAAFIDGATAEAYGYLKNDLLPVDVVKVNAEIYKRIGIPQPTVPELIETTAKDKATWSMYAQGLTMGLNQCEKEKSSEKVKTYKPHNISEMSAFVAGIRPAFQSMVGLLLTRKHFDYKIPELDKLLQTKEMSSSFILYQEQMMTILQYAGFSAPESYSSIKAIAKKHPEKVLPLKERFLQGFAEKLVSGGVLDDIAQDTADRVWVIISDACGYGFNASHSVSVALDSMYTAWAKAHHPLETYTVLMSNYAAKGDKDRIDLAKIEMKRGFGIRVVPCRFRQDNRDYYIDHKANTISDALMSVKHVSKRVAETLYAMRDNRYDTFIDLLYEMEMKPAFDSRNVDILIRMGYFEEFGSAGKLLKIMDAFRNGKGKFSKALIEATQQKRLAALREYERSLPEEDLPMSEIMSFEIEHYGSPISTFPDEKGCFAVVDLDTTYSPKAKLYNVATGTVGLMKIRKPVFNKTPFEVGDVIHMEHWEKKPAYQFVEGKPKAKPGVYDLWLKEYFLLDDNSA